MSFKVTARDGAARCGELSTAHGVVETPVFMPVATQGSVKAISQEDLKELGVRALLSNSYHLYLRPGVETVRAAGGLHAFMNFDGMILTDSGGFQVLSLSDLRKIDDEGIDFRSHIDGSLHRLTPEKVIEVQAGLGSDCWTTLDECPPFPCDVAHARRALERTISWTERSVPALQKARDAGARALFFPILQGSLYKELRCEAARRMEEIPADGISIGGFMVGEEKPKTWELLEATTEALPRDKPRYLMGVGTPEDLWHSIALGVDMMDCVWPTRVARNGQVMTRQGRYNITGTANRRDFSPLEPGCSCFVCAKYTRAYLGHLFRAKELVVHRLISFHNLHLMAEIVREIRAAISQGRFAERRRAFLDGYRVPVPAR